MVGEAMEDDTTRIDRRTDGTARIDRRTDGTARISRRTVVRGTAGILLGGAVGGAVLFSENVAASGFTLQASDVEAATGDGTISEVYLRPKLTVWWQNFNEEVDEIGVEIETRIDGETDWEAVLAETVALSGNERGADGEIEESLIEGNQRVTLYDGPNIGYFEASGDGEEEVTTVTLRGTVELRSGNELADPESSARFDDETAFDVTVENLEAGAGGTLEADTGVEG